MKKELSIIIPSYLESENLKQILPKVHMVLQEIVTNYEVIIVDTVVPMDNTPQVCKENNVKYCNTSKQDSYGNAIRTGIGQIHSEHTIVMDADGSCDPGFIKELYNNRAGNDVVIASRYIEGGGTNNTRFEVISSLVVNKLFSIILNIKCKDTSISFKLYKTDDLKKLVLNCKNFDILQEILFKLKKAKPALQIKEIPFTFTKRMFGKSKRKLVVFIASYLHTILKLRFEK